MDTQILMDVRVESLNRIKILAYIVISAFQQFHRVSVAKLKTFQTFIKSPTHADAFF